MELQTILTVKQEPFEALVRSIKLYMEQDECVCNPMPDLPLFQSVPDQACPPECERCTWCIGRKALRGVGQLVDA